MDWTRSCPVLELWWFRWIRFDARKFSNTEDFKCCFWKGKIKYSSVSAMHVSHHWNHDTRPPSYQVCALLSMWIVSSIHFDFFLQFNTTVWVMFGNTAFNLMDAWDLSTSAENLLPVHYLWKCVFNQVNCAWTVDRPLMNRKNISYTRVYTAATI